jgi:hypothetical protein
MTLKSVNWASWLKWDQIWMLAGMLTILSLFSSVPSRQYLKLDYDPFLLHFCSSEFATKKKTNKQTNNLRGP